MSALRLSVVLGVVAAVLAAVPAHAQTDDYDASWYDASAPYVQIQVAADGVYRVDAAALRPALPDGTTLADIPPETIRLLDKGREVPIQLSGTGDGRLDDGDTITFVGQRNRGTDELWAYNGDASAQSSSYYSLYSDTTTYWMTWGNGAGLRYQEETSTGAAATTTSVRDTLHAERDNRYYFGRPRKNGNSLYTESEGYFWRRFSHNDTDPITFTQTLAVGRRTEAPPDTLDLSVRLDGATASCHRVEIEANLRQSGGGTAFESLTTAEWQRFNRQTVRTTVAQDRIPDGGLELRLTSYNGGFSSDLNCPDPGSTPNYVLLDWIEAAYTRTLAADDERQRVPVRTTASETYALSGYTGNTVSVYNPRDARRYEAAVTGGTATVTAAPSTAPTAYWAVGPGGFRAPAAVRTDQPSNWAAPSNAADYLILTTRALRPSARRLASYRRSPEGGGHQVEVAIVQNVFDEFDYGRPTPIAIRRFVRASQDWDVAPRFLTIFADAQYPIDDGSVDSLYPEWSVPSFGYSPSDGWFAMQSDGPEDWSETLAVGRIPVRSVPQGDLFIDKLKTYEQAPLERWQKRMLLLAGGTTEREQNDLQQYSNWWGEIASDTAATTQSYSGPAYTGMDTLQYYKKVNDALDVSFQDSLAVDLERGSGWLSYFGHSAAQTWEIVTDPPSEFGNAGRLPVVVSLGCRTGSFAGGRFEEKDAPSLGEQLVVGSVRPDGTPRDGARNGGIAHFGESALGNLIPSARINDALVRRVFVDTSRVLGTAIRNAKAEIAAQYGTSAFYVKHLLQYGLLGDPATQLALPAKPDLHVSANQVSIRPLTPTPSEELRVTVGVQNRGLIPSDSVTVELTWQRPDGSSTRRTRRVERFPLERTLQFAFTPADNAVGTNTFRVQVDPENEYAERSETDNVTEKTQVVFDTRIDLIAPEDQGVAATRQPTLQFSLPRRDAETEPPPVTLQLDSVPSFDSPALRETTVQNPGLSERWTPSDPLRDSTTYYWRGRLNTGGEMRWREQRFTVQTAFSGDGWLQQGRLFQTNENSRLRWTPQTNWSFAPFTRDIFVTSERGSGAFKGVISVDGAQRYVNLTLGYGIVVMDGTTGRVEKAGAFCTFEVSTSLQNDFCGQDQDGTEAINRMDNFLTSVDAGDYVFVRTRHLGRSSSADIPARVETLLRTLGGSAVHSEAMAPDSLNYNDLWLMVARKGDPSRTVEKVALASEDENEITYRTDLSFRRPQGRTTTDRIGPVSGWKTLRWDATGASSATMDVEVLAADTNRVLAQSQGLQGTLSLDAVDPATHPYLRLRATLTDSTARVPPQLDRWSVSYDGVPELVVDPAGLASLADTLQQGATGTLALPVVNLGPVASEEVRLRYSVTDASNVSRSLPTDTLAGLAPGARDTSTVPIETTDLPGQNTFSARAETATLPERLTSNNAVVRSFFVRRDQTAPSVRVLANGREIPATAPSTGLQAPNLPYVSTQPSFEIVLEDDNPNLPLDDTSHVSVYLKEGTPETEETCALIDCFDQVPFSGSALTLLSSDSSPANALRVLYEPDLSAQDSTTYTLKVEGEDAKGNEVEPFQGSFRVQQNQVIRDVYPYPNPMSDHTTFAFRVKGGTDEMLRDFGLRIYTLSGRLVREFTQSDLETPLGVGWNTLRWNGRDQDGDPVATGVYLYRVRVKGDDQTFHGDVEKVTVIR
jgi:hypothetical protein